MNEENYAKVYRDDGGVYIDNNIGGAVNERIP